MPEMLTPLQAGTFTHRSIEEISKILKEKFNNLSAQEIINLAGRIAMKEFEVLMEVTK